MKRRTYSTRPNTRRRRLLSETLETRHLLAGPYAPAAGQVGSDAIGHDDASIVAWASRIEDYSPGTDVAIGFQTPGNAIGPAESGLPATVSLGRGGTLTLTFDAPIRDGLGADFAVFENSFSDAFLELGYVEVSSDGVNFFRFQSDSLTPSAVDAFGSVDPTEIQNLAGKYRAGFGTPFDLAELAASNSLLDTTAVTHVRLVDVVGDGNSLDASGDPIFDPFPTVGSAGLDVDAVGVIHQAEFEFDVVGFEDVGVSLSTESAFSGPDPNGTSAPGPFSNIVTTGEFTSERLAFNNSNESSFGAWTGWSYSNVTDNTTPGFGNQFGSFAGEGASGSATFGVGFVDVNGTSPLPTITREDSDLRQLDSIQITNSTYAALSMLNGDQFAKQFGGDTGNDPDFFLLTIDGKDAAGASIGTVDFYLADYRFDDNSLDFIVDEWTTVDLSSISDARAIEFSLSSSDVGSFGVNTPAYFAADDIRFAQPILPIDLADLQVSEDGGNAATTGRVSRADLDDASAITVSLAVSADGTLTVPSSVTIPAGQAFVEFPVGVIDNQVANGPSTLLISASADGFVDGSAALTVVDDEVPALGLSLAATTVAEGDAVEVTVSRNDADLTQSRTIRLESTPQGFLTLADSYEIPAGQTSVTVSIVATEDQIDRSDTQVGLVATADGYSPSESVLLVTDNDDATVAIAFDGSELSEDDAALLVGFEDRGATLPAEAFYNGSDLAGGFVSSTLQFNNNFNPTFGSWSGWAVSNTTDTTTPGFGNQYSAFTGTGADGSETYAVASAFTLPTITRPATGPAFTELAITNTTYAALSMLNGDQFAKQFGGETGNDEDFFVVQIEGVDVDGQSTGTIDFYLADFRFADNSLDFIVDQWTTVDLTGLGDATELQFSLMSSDVGDFGINTPAYFAIDNLVLGDPTPVPASATAVVSRNSADVSMPLDVRLESDDTSELRVPSTVTIPAGSASVIVPLEVRDDALVDGPQSVSVSVIAENNIGGSASIVVADNDQPILTLTALTPSVAESQNGRLLVYRNSADTSEAITVSVTPQSTGLVVIDSEHTIPAGSRRVEIPFQANDDSEINNDVSLLFQVTSAGFASSDASVLIVNDDFPPPALALELSSDSLAESDAATAAGFEDLGARIADESFDNGANGAGGFIDAGVALNNSFEPTFGSWGGWSISKTSDQTTPGFTNQYSAITGSGAFGSQTYAVASAFPGGTVPTLTLDGSVQGQSFQSLQITNTTYAALSIRDGDAFAKQFGGESSDDPDFFLLTIDGVDAAGASVGVVEFYLADFRFDDNSQDFIVDEWTTVDVSSLSAASELRFSVSSSDVGAFGLNTPAYFAIDEVVVADAPANIVTATVTRIAQDLSDDLVVELAVDDPSEATLPMTVTIPAGSASASFQIQAIEDAVFDGDQSVEVTVSADSFESTQQNLTITDNEQPTLTLSVSNDELNESDSSSGVELLVHRNTGNLTIPLVVDLSLVDGAPQGRIQFPDSVTIPVGARTASVFISAVDDSIAMGDQTVGFAASASGFVSTPTAVTVRDDEAIDIVIEQPDGDIVVGDPQLPGRFTVRLAAQPATEVVIELTPQSTKIALGDVQLRFSPDDWDVPQTVEVANQFDFEIEDGFVSSVVLSVVDASSDPAFATLDDSSLSVAVVDFQPAVVRLSEGNGRLRLLDDQTQAELVSVDLRDGFDLMANDLAQTIVIDQFVQTRGLIQIDAAGGDDTVVLQGNRFGSLDGGAGHDVLIVDLNLSSIDLVSLLANRTVRFEEFVVVSDAPVDLIVNAETVSSLANEDGALLLRLASQQQLSLSGETTVQSPAMVNGEFAQVIDVGGSTLQVISETPWHNTFDAFDVDQSGAVTPADILAVIERIVEGPATLATISSMSDFDGRFVDVSGDGLLTPADILEVINFLADVAAAGGSAGTENGPQGELLESVRQANVDQNRDPEETLLEAGGAGARTAFAADHTADPAASDQAVLELFGDDQQESQQSFADAESVDVFAAGIETLTERTRG